MTRIQKRQLMMLPAWIVLIGLLWVGEAGERIGKFAANMLERVMDWCESR